MAETTEGSVDEMIDLYNRIGNIREKKMDDDLIFKDNNIGLEPNRYELINKEYLFKFKWRNII